MIDHFSYVIAASVFGTGMYGLVTSRNLIHLCLCLAVFQSSTYVLLVGIGYRDGGIAPIFTQSDHATAVDSVVQALMLTDIVVEATVVALLLALAVQVHKCSKTTDPQKIGQMKG